MDEHAAQIFVATPLVPDSRAFSTLCPEKPIIKTGGQRDARQ